MNLYAILFAALAVGIYGLLLVGGLCLCILRLAEAVQLGLGTGTAAELKRALKAVEGRVDDAVDHFEHRTRKEEMRERRSKKDGEQMTLPGTDRLAQLRIARARANGVGGEQSPSSAT